MQRYLLGCFIVCMSLQVTGVPQENYESFQILRYEEGEFYRSHHDSSGKSDKISGHRIMTVFLYLNDVEGEIPLF